VALAAVVAADAIHVRKSELGREGNSVAIGLRVGDAITEGHARFLPVGVR